MMNFGLKCLQLALEIVHRKPEATPKKYYAERRKQRSVLPKPTPGMVMLRIPVMFVMKSCVGK